MKVDVSAEVSPSVGTEKQGEDMVAYMAEKIEESPDKIWETNLFGKTLHDLVKEGLNDKIMAMPQDARNKLRKTLSRMVNENKGGMICILL
jgi:stage IV sporulation protein A